MQYVLHPVSWFVFFYLPKQVRRDNELEYDNWRFVLHNILTSVTQFISY